METQDSVVWTVGPDDVGDRQMAIDTQMAKAAVTSGLVFARLYHFTPPCISLGRFQKDDEIDPDRCREYGIDITRRPTGGRAVLHKGDLVYSIAVPLEQRDQITAKGMFHVGVYNQVSEAIQQALNQLGLGAGSTEGSAEKIDADLPRARLCFSSATPYEVQIEGRKVVGSAQHKYKKVVLQHGSILIRNDHLQLVDLLPGLTDTVRNRLRKSLQRQTTSFVDAGFSGEETELISALESSFERQFGKPERLSADEFLARLISLQGQSID